MKISKVNDLSDLIKEKEKLFKFRKLEKNNAKYILEFMTKWFLSDN